MGRVSTADWYRSGRRGGANKFEGRKELIARAARTCLERKGVAKTSIADITREVDITRELFYYYYPNKDAVVEAVIEGYLADARGILLHNVESAEDEPRELLLAVMRSLRTWLATDDTMPFSMFDVMNESRKWTSSLYTVAGEAIEVLRGTDSFAGGEGLAVSTIKGRRIALMGAMGTMRVSDTSDDEIVEGIAPLFY